MWYRVFGRAETEPSPAALVEYLQSVGLVVEPHFKGDDLGWTSGELRLGAGGTPVDVQRYLTSEDDLRDDLNAHAAELETHGDRPNVTRLMTHVIQTKQLITLRRPVDVVDEVTLEKVLLEVCRFLATQTDGLYQIDGRGWFAVGGEMLLQEH